MFALTFTPKCWIWSSFFSECAGLYTSGVGSAGEETQDGRPGAKRSGYHHGHRTEGITQDWYTPHTTLLPKELLFVLKLFKCPSSRSEGAHWQLNKLTDHSYSYVLASWRGYVSISSIFCLNCNLLSVSVSLQYVFVSLLSRDNVYDVLRRICTHLQVCGSFIRLFIPLINRWVFSMKIKSLPTNHV